MALGALSRCTLTMRWVARSLATVRRRKNTSPTSTNRTGRRYGANRIYGVRSSGIPSTSEGTTRSEGNAQDINTKGIVTFDHKYRKDPYFFYKANWTATPTVHINSSLYTERAYRVADVRVYSNAPRTSLKVNGKVIGVLAACPDRICVWNGVALSPGANNIIATGSFSQGDVEDKTQWHLSDTAAKNVYIDCGALVAGASDGKHF